MRAGATCAAGALVAAFAASAFEGRRGASGRIAASRPRRWPPGLGKLPRSCQGGAAGRPLLSYELLKKDDAETNDLVQEFFKGDAMFQRLARQRCEAIQGRDAEDGAKLQKGIDFGIEKGVLPAHIAVEPVRDIQVNDRAMRERVDEIVAALGDAVVKGCVVVVQGLTGTSKGSTVKELVKRLPNAVAWSNGNLFRSLTLLAVTYTEQQGRPLEDALVPDVLQSFMGMLSFGKFGDDFDVEIQGLGLSLRVGEIQNTILKEPRVEKCIPTVAKATQGEVIVFVQGVLDQLTAAGKNVIVEGREQTLNYIRSPHRFNLVLEHRRVGCRQRPADGLWNGLRSAAQLVAAEAVRALEQGGGQASCGVAAAEALGPALERVAAKSLPAK